MSFTTLRRVVSVLAAALIAVTIGVGTASADTNQKTQPKASCYMTIAGNTLTFADGSQVTVTTSDGKKYNLTCSDGTWYVTSQPPTLTFLRSVVAVSTQPAIIP
jgi:hypothetical protein